MRKISCFFVLAIMCLVVVGISGCTGIVTKDKTIVECGHIKSLPVDSEWHSYGVIMFSNNKFYVVQTMDSQSYALLKFAYLNNCNVSVILSHWTDNEYTIPSTGVSLLDCGCEK